MIYRTLVIGIEPTLMVKTVKQMASTRCHLSYKGSDQGVELMQLVGLYQSTVNINTYLPDLAWLEAHSLKLGRPTKVLSSTRVFL